MEVLFSLLKEKKYTISARSQLKIQNQLMVEQEEYTWKKSKKLDSLLKFK